MFYNADNKTSFERVKVLKGAQILLRQDVVLFATAELTHY